VAAPAVAPVEAHDVPGEEPPRCIGRGQPKLPAEVLAAPAIGHDLAAFHPPGDDMVHRAGGIEARLPRHAGRVGLPGGRVKLLPHRRPPLGNSKLGADERGVTRGRPTPGAKADPGANQGETEVGGDAASTISLRQLKTRLQVKR
jgi:hypothetical protein